MVKGINHLWLIGDEFTDRSHLVHFKHAHRPEPVDQQYSSEKFELICYTTTQYSSSTRNILARFKLLIAKAIQEQILLPKIILLVPDDDIIKQSNVKDEGTSGYVVIMSYLVEEINRMLTAYKTKLPKKCIQDWFLHVVWILPPTHKYFSNNTDRECFALAMEQILQDQYPNNCALRLKKVWDKHDGELYYREQ